MTSKDTYTETELRLFAEIVRDLREEDKPKLPAHACGCGTIIAVALAIIVICLLLCV